MRSETHELYVTGRAAKKKMTHKKKIVPFKKGIGLEILLKIL